MSVEVGESLQSKIQRLKAKKAAEQQQQQTHAQTTTATKPLIHSTVDSHSLTRLSTHLPTQKRHTTAAQLTQTSKIINKVVSSSSSTGLSVSDPHAAQDSVKRKRKAASTRETERTTVTPARSTDRASQHAHPSASAPELIHIVPSSSVSSSPPAAAATGGKIPRPIPRVVSQPSDSASAAIFSITPSLLTGNGKVDRIDLASTAHLTTFGTSSSTAYSSSVSYQSLSSRESGRRLTTYQALEEEYTEKNNAERDGDMGSNFDAAFLAYNPTLAAAAGLTKENVIQNKQATLLGSSLLSLAEGMYALPNMDDEILPDRDVLSYKDL